MQDKASVLKETAELLEKEIDNLARRIEKMMDQQEGLRRALRLVNSKAEILRVQAKQEEAANGPSNS